ncbi:hypothetical protein KC614_02185 [candidate division WWE3 bacterium]|uniref:Uncharacterized protein n=1 Tax=candidate division WWE3 bacterium TaxID=2053526 RepID=A0A955RRX1_UNCKA|nr:hypothetical protein [candidate division WWE3 bacterium]
MFTIYRPYEELVHARALFNEYRNHLVEQHDEVFHVSNLQVFEHAPYRHVGIATWPQFLPTIIPHVDYVMIAFNDERGHHAHVGRLNDIADVLRHFSFVEEKEPVQHYKLPMLHDMRWRKRVLEVTNLVDTTS